MRRTPAENYKTLLQIEFFVTTSVFSRAAISG
jgi:hypothetical protein